MDKLHADKAAQIIKEVHDAAVDPNLGGIPGMLNPDWVARKMKEAHEHINHLGVRSGSQETLR